MKSNLRKAHNERTWNHLYQNLQWRLRQPNQWVLQMMTIRQRFVHNSQLGFPCSSISSSYFAETSQVFLNIHSTKQDKCTNEINERQSGFCYVLVLINNVRKVKLKMVPLFSSLQLSPKLNDSPFSLISFKYWLRRLHVWAKLDLSGALPVVRLNIWSFTDEAMEVEQACGA